jgi:hypothetical protein
VADAVTLLGFGAALNPVLLFGAIKSGEGSHWIKSDKVGALAGLIEYYRRTGKTASP